MRCARFMDRVRNSSHFAILGDDLASAALLPASFDISDLFRAICGNEADSTCQETIAVIPLPCSSQGSKRYSFLPPVPTPSKIICVGLNYAKHVNEFTPGAEPPKEPLIFTKLSSSVIPTQSFVQWDASKTNCVDYEGELAVVIGKKCRQVGTDLALDHVLGYTCANDITARDWQKHDGQWTRAKGSDTFCPLGPYLLSPAELSLSTSRAPSPLVRVSTTVNGDVKQDAPIGQMIHSVAEIISYCSSFCTLLPGDVILTGTPEGVGMGTCPPTYLASGDKVVVELETPSFRMQLVSECRTF